MGCVSSSEAGSQPSASASSSSSSGGRLLKKKWLEIDEVEAGVFFSRASLRRIEMQTHPFDKYHVLEHLGAGGFADVKRVREKMCSFVSSAALQDVDIENDYAMKIIRAFPSGAVGSGSTSHIFSPQLFFINHLAWHGKGGGIKRKDGGGVCEPSCPQRVNV